MSDDEENEKKSLLEMAVELDEMERTVPSDEADFLDGALKSLKARRALKPKDEAKLESMYNKYFGKKDDDDEEEEKPPKDDPEEELDMEDAS